MLKYIIEILIVIVVSTLTTFCCIGAEQFLKVMLKDRKEKKHEKNN